MLSESQVEAQNRRLRAALQRILHYPLPRITASTPPSLARDQLREALVQVRRIAQDGLHNG